MPPSASHAARLDAPDFYRVAPDATRALRDLGAAVEASGLEKDLLELVKVRASQINGCGYCVQYHLNVARKLRVPQAKLDLVVVWREAGIFSTRECAALELTEVLSAAIAGGVSDALWAGVRAMFSESEAAFLTAAIANINAWNRIGVALRFSPPIPAAA